MYLTPVLANKPRDERVQRVVEPMPSGASHRRDTPRDRPHVRHLGLVALNSLALAIRQFGSPEGAPESTGADAFLTHLTTLSHFR